MFGELSVLVVDEILVLGALAVAMLIVAAAVCWGIAALCDLEGE